MFSNRFIKTMSYFLMSSISSKITRYKTIEKMRKSPEFFKHFIQNEVAYIYDFKNLELGIDGRIFNRESRNLGKLNLSVIGRK